MSKIEKHIHSVDDRVFWRRTTVCILCIKNLAILFLAILVIFPTISNSTEKNKIINIGVIPHAEGGDETEQLMKLYMGQEKGIDHIIAPSSPEEFFNTLIKYKENGFRINRMIIAGHGESKVPHIKFGEKILMPGDLDFRHQIENWESIQKKNAGDKKKTKIIQSKLENFREKQAYLDSVSGVMTPKAQVELINCSPLATKKGEQFVTNLGVVLMGTNGGEIKASTSDIEIGQVKNNLTYIYVPLIDAGRWAKANDIVAIGDWKTITIPSCKGKNFHFKSVDEEFDFILLTPEELFNETGRFIGHPPSNEQKENIFKQMKDDYFTNREHYRKILSPACLKDIELQHLFVVWDGEYQEKGKKLKVYKRGYSVKNSINADKSENTTEKKIELKLGTGWGVIPVIPTYE